MTQKLKALPPRMVVLKNISMALTVGPSIFASHLSVECFLVCKKVAILILYSFFDMPVDQRSQKGAL